MTPQIIHPDSEEHWLQLRTQDLTSTDVAALFGLSPYKTHFELWHEKKSGERVQFAENERMKWGRRLESTVAEGIAADQEWAVRPMKEYVRIPDLRLGSSFDYRIMLAGKLAGRSVLGAVAEADDWVNATDSEDDAILEIKTVDWLAFRDGWTVEEGFIEAPPHIELQVQHQMLVSGLQRAYIGVMVGGNDIRLIEREADPAVHAGIKARAAAFWRSIEENNPPPPVMPDDADAVIAMHQYADPGKLKDARGDANLAIELARYNELGVRIRMLEEDRKVLKAELLERIGDAEKVMADGFSVSAGMVGPSEVSYTRQGYRNFRVTAKKRSTP